MNIYIIILLVIFAVSVVMLLFFLINRKKIQVKILEEKAEKGDADTQLALGIMFLTGSKIPMNKEKGEKYIKKAADNGNAQAQYLYSGIVLGVGHNQTEHSKEQLLEAASWIEKSAEGGFLEAIITLANMYADGKILKRDRKKSEAYFLKAAEMGHIESQVTIAGIYDLSIDYDRAIGYAWYKVAEHNGNEYAIKASEKLFNELSTEDKERAIHKADEYINKYTGKN